MIDELQRSVKPGWSVADVGASYGEYTKLLSGLVGRAGSVVAFEANPVTARALAQNVKHRRNVTVEPVAVGDRSGHVEIRNDGAYSWTWSMRASSGEALTVPAVALDDRLARVDLVKVDVEGAEGLVLAGMTRLMAESRPRIIVETHGPVEEEEVTRISLAAGYRMRSLDATHLLCWRDATSEGSEPIGAGPPP